MQDGMEPAVSKLFKSSSMVCSDKFQHFWQVVDTQSLKLGTEGHFTAGILTKLGTEGHFTADILTKLGTEGYFTAGILTKLGTEGYFTVTLLPPV